MPLCCSKVTATICCHHGPTPYSEERSLTISWCDIFFAPARVKTSNHCFQVFPVFAFRASSLMRGVGFDFTGFGMNDSFFLSGQLLVVSCQLSVVSGQLSVVGRQWLIVSGSWS